MILLPKLGRWTRAARAARKKPKPPKKRKPSRKRIASKSVFKAHGDNPLKSYRRRFTDYQVMIRAEACRQQRLRNRTRAEMAFAELLDRHRILYEIEKIVQNGDRFVLLDVWLPKWNLAIELDGSAHRHQEQYDYERSMWLARTHGMKVVRFQNADVFNGKAEQRIKEMLGLSCDNNGVMR